jgi:hypothetical protein
VYIPAFIKARELGKILNLDAKEVVKFARAEGFRFRKPHEIILSFPDAAKLAVKRRKNPVYIGTPPTVSNQQVACDVDGFVIVRDGCASRGLLVEWKRPIESRTTMRCIGIGTRRSW